MKTNGFVLCKAKLLHDDVMKRFELRHPLKFIDLQTEIFTRFSLNGDNAGLSYVNSEGTSVALKNDADLAAASMCLTKGTEPYLHINVFRKKQTDDKEVDTFVMTDSRPSSDGSICGKVYQVGSLTDACKALELDTEEYEVLSAACGDEDIQILQKDTLNNDVQPQIKSDIDPKPDIAMRSKSIDTKQILTSEAESNVEKDTNTFDKQTLSKSSGLSPELCLSLLIIGGVLCAMIWKMGSDIATSPSSATSDLAKLFKNNHLEDISGDVCKKLGVSKVAHLAFVNEQDIEKLNLKPVHRNALKGLVNRIQQTNKDPAITRIEEETSKRSQHVRKIRQILSTSPATSLVHENIDHSRFPKFQFMIFGAVGVGKSTTLHWLCRHAGMGDEICRQFVFRHYGDHTHTTKLVGTTLDKVRIFDTAGLSNLYPSKAFGIKVLAGGYQKESCDIMYVSRPEPNYIFYPDMADEASKCLYDEPNPDTVAHAVLLLVKYTEDRDELQGIRGLLEALRQDEEAFWCANGVEPVVAVTHLERCRSGVDVCVSTLAQQLSVAADDVLPLVPGGVAECEMHGYGELCKSAGLNFIPAIQYAPMLQALKARALTVYKRAPQRPAGLEGRLASGEVVEALKTKARAANKWLLSRIEQAA